MAQIIADTGPLVALFAPREEHHSWTRASFEHFREPMISCEPVLTEVAFLLGRSPITWRKITTLLEQGLLRIEFSLADHRSEVFALMKRHSDLSMSLADACLVRMTEVHTEAKVWTLDRDFKTYRRLGRRVVPTLMP